MQCLIDIPIRRSASQFLLISGIMHLLGSTLNLGISVEKAGKREVGGSSPSARFSEMLRFCNQKLSKSMCVLEMCPLLFRNGGKAL